MENVEKEFKVSELTAEEVINILQNENKEGYIQLYDLGWDDFIRNYDKIEVESVDSFGGEGKGEDIWVVYKITNKSNPSDITYIKIQGYYSSWDGSDWDCGSQTIVKPVEITRIEYR